MLGLTAWPQPRPLDESGPGPTADNMEDGPTGRRHPCAVTGGLVIAQTWLESGL